MSAKNPSDEPEKVIVPVESLKDFIVRCTVKVGAKLDHAEVLAELLVSADHRGHYSHGLNRIDYYLSDVKNGYNAADKEPEVVRQTVATALVDGNNCLGPVVGKFAMDVAIEKAKSAGIGWVSVKGSNHFGIAGWYSIRAMEQGLIGLTFTNTSPCMVPTRGKTKTLGTNPLSVAARGSNGEEFVLDMATTTVALGKVEVKHRLGEKNIPPSWGVDRHGKPSTDTEEVLYHGAGSPLGGAEETGGYKGYGLAVMVEVFCGILSGSAFGSNIRDWPTANTAADLGHCFVAIDPKAFASGFEDRMSQLIHQCKDQEPAAGESEILVPGDPENKHIKLCSTLGGIPYHPTEIEFADQIAKKYDVEILHRL